MVLSRIESLQHSFTTCSLCFCTAIRRVDVFLTSNFTGGQCGNISQALFLARSLT
jgi:hypothetical protein